MGAPIDFHFAPDNKMVLKLMTAVRGDIQLNMGSEPLWYTSYSQRYHFVGDKRMVRYV